jgi:hypothetical protein
MRTDLRISIKNYQRELSISLTDASPPSHPPGKLSLTQLKTISILRNLVIKNQLGAIGISVTRRPFAVK